MISAKVIDQLEEFQIQPSKFYYLIKFIKV